MRRPSGLIYIFIAAMSLLSSRLVEAVYLLEGEVSMRAIRIDRWVLLSAIFSAGMVLGCGSGEDEDEGAKISALLREGEKAAEVADYPPCGQEMPFSLALRGMYNGVALDQTFAASSEDFPYPQLWIDIAWEDSAFIALGSLDLLPDDRKGPMDVLGQFLLGSDRSQIDSILYGSVLTLEPEEKLWKLYLRTARGTIIGVICDRR
jgi:hypothetical protein